MIAGQVITQLMAAPGPPRYALTSGSVSTSTIPSHSVSRALRSTSRPDSMTAADKPGGVVMGLDVATLECRWSGLSVYRHRAILIQGYNLKFQLSMSHMST